MNYPLVILILAASVIVGCSDGESEHSEAVRILEEFQSGTNVTDEELNDWLRLSLTQYYGLQKGFSEMATDAEALVDDLRAEFADFRFQNAELATDLIEFGSSEMPIETRNAAIRGILTFYVSIKLPESLEQHSDIPEWLELKERVEELRLRNPDLDKTLEQLKVDQSPRPPWVNDNNSTQPTTKKPLVDLED